MATSVTLGKENRAPLENSSHIFSNIGNLGHFKSQEQMHFTSKPSFSVLFKDCWANLISVSKLLLLYCLVRRPIMVNYDPQIFCSKVLWEQQYFISFRGQMIYWKLYSALLRSRTAVINLEKVDLREPKSESY